MATNTDHNYGNDYANIETEGDTSMNDNITAENIDNMSESEVKSLAKRMMDKVTNSWNTVVASDQASNLVTSSKFALELQVGQMFTDYAYNTGMVFAPAPISKLVDSYPKAEFCIKFLVGAAASSVLTYGRHQTPEQWRWLVGPLERGCMHNAMTNFPKVVSLDEIFSRVFCGADAKLVLERLKQAESLNSK